MIHGQPEACCLDSNGLLDCVDGEAVLLARAITHLLHIKASISVSPRQGRDLCCKWPSMGGSEHSRSSSVRGLTSIAGWLLLPCCKVDVEGIATFKTWWHFQGLNILQVRQAPRQSCIWTLWPKAAQAFRFSSSSWVKITLKISEELYSFWSSFY